MVINSVKSIFEKQKEARVQRDRDKNDELEHRENEEIQQAEEIKKEADRLAQLKQYKTSIQEYERALTLFPFNGSEEELFSNMADFLFKVHYNIAACYSYLNSFDRAIECFDQALTISNVDDESKVKAFMGKGTSFFQKKLIVDGQVKKGGYHVSMDSDFSIDERQIEAFRREDNKFGLINLAHDCFSKAVELDGKQVDAWYKKGHMEFLQGDAKRAVQSFDAVLNLKKNYENTENIRLFDEIKRERGIPIPTSEIKMRENDAEPLFRTKTGHMVRNRAELAVANFLYDHNLLFEYDNVAAWADNDNFRPNFFVPKLGLYIDHFGLDYMKEYQKIMKGKLKQYEKKKKKYVFTTSEDETSIEEALKVKMKPYFVL